MDYYLVVGTQKLHSGLLWMQPGQVDCNLVGRIAKPTSAFCHPPAPSFHMHDQSTGPVIKRDVRIGR